MEQAELAAEESEPSTAEDAHVAGETWPWSFYSDSDSQWYKI